MLCPLIYCIVLCIHCCSIVLYALASTDTRDASTGGRVVFNVLYEVKRLSKLRSLFLMLRVC